MGVDSRHRDPVSAGPGRPAGRTIPAWRRGHGRRGQSARGSRRTGERSAVSAPPPGDAGISDDSDSLGRERPSNSRLRRRCASPRAVVLIQLRVSRAGRHLSGTSSGIRDSCRNVSVIDGNPQRTASDSLADRPSLLTFTRRCPVAPRHRVCTTGALWDVCAAPRRRCRGRTWTARRFRGRRARIEVAGRFCKKTNDVQAGQRDARSRHRYAQRARRARAQRRPPHRPRSSAEAPAEALRDSSDPQQIGLQLLVRPETHGRLGAGASDISRVSAAMAAIDLGMTTSVRATA
jgi:hypothetical protein